MMVLALGVRDQSIDECDRFRKSLEGELLADGIAIEGPAVERLQLSVDFRFRKKCHIRTSELQSETIGTDQLQVRISCAVDHEIRDQLRRQRRQEHAVALM